MPQTIAIDVMGGDVGPNVTIPAAIESLKRHPNLHIILVGNEDIVNSHLLKYQKKETSRVKIRHATEVVSMDEPPQIALKNKKDSSMRVAINLIKLGEASACVSAGNTGALMATARFVLKTLPEIDRPAIASLLPSIQGTTCLLDLGANVDSSPKQLLQFAIMGAMLSSVLKKEKTPSMGPCDQFRDYVHVQDVVKGILLSSKLTGSTTLNLGSGRYVQVNEFVSMFWDYLGGDRNKLKFGSRSIRLGEPDQPKSFADLTHLKQITGWVPELSLQDGVRLTIEKLDEMRLPD